MAQRHHRPEAHLLLARARAGARQRRRAGDRRHADRPRRLPARLRGARGAAAGEPGLGALRAGRGARRSGGDAAPAELVGPARRARLHAPPVRQLAARVELGRAYLPGADPRPRARLQRVGDRPHPRRLRDRGGGRAARDPAARASPARIARPGRRDADVRRRLRDLSARADRVGHGLLRRRPRPGARRRPADGHDDAAPDHAGGAPRRGDRACARWRSTCRARSCRWHSASPARRWAPRRCSG